jgi:glycosyltransferase involved in cell wall biosynthesis
MPIRNEAAFIQRSLGAILNQDYPPDKIEILIADGMSDDATCDLIRQMPGIQRVRIIANPQCIQAAGLNLLIPQALGEYIIRVDGHTIIAPNYISQCVELLQSSGAHNVGGPMSPVGVTPIGRAIALAGTSAFSVPSVFRVSQTAQYTDTVYLGAWPRSIFQSIGLYNTHVGVNEDYELNYRIRQAGGKVFFSPTIRSEYYGRQTLQMLAQQYYRYGSSKVKMLAQHPGSLKVRHGVAPLFVAWVIIGLLLGLLFPALLLFWGSGLLLYGAINLLFSFRTVWREDRALVWLIPIVFLTIHLAWGAGFWVGLFRMNRPYA